jgi:hypothetical protein
LPNTATLPIPSPIKRRPVRDYEEALTTNPIRINGDLLIDDSLAQPGTQAESYGAANPQGEVAVSYFSLQNDPQKQFLVDHYVRVSRDGGRTFEAPVRVTPNSFDVRFAALAGNAFFLGDYNGLAGSASGFHMVWVATSLPSRLREFQPDVFFARTIN